MEISKGRYPRGDISGEVSRGDISGEVSQGRYLRLFFLSRFFFFGAIIGTGLGGSTLSIKPGISRVHD